MILTGRVVVYLTAYLALASFSYVLWIRFARKRHWSKFTQYFSGFWIGLLSPLMLLAIWGGIRYAATVSSEGMLELITALLFLVCTVFGAVYFVVKVIPRFARKFIVFLGNRVAEAKVPTIVSAPNASDRQPAKPEVSRPVNAPGLVLETSSGGSTTLSMYLDDAEQAFKLNDVNEIRRQLQKMAYLMVGPSVTDKDKQQFAAFVARFAQVDPLYIAVVDRLRHLLQDTPGIVQSTLYKGESEHDQEMMRYVLYYAEFLGEIVRIKKGSSYRLYLPGQEPDPLKPIN